MASGSSGGSATSSRNDRRPSGTYAASSQSLAVRNSPAPAANAGSCPNRMSPALKKRPRPHASRVFPAVRRNPGSRARRNARSTSTAAAAPASSPASRRRSALRLSRPRTSRLPVAVRSSRALPPAPSSSVPSGSDSPLSSASTVTAVRRSAAAGAAASSPSRRAVANVLAPQRSREDSKSQFLQGEQALVHRDVHLDGVDQKHRARVLLHQVGHLQPHRDQLVPTLTR